MIITPMISHHGVAAEAFERVLGIQQPQFGKQHHHRDGDHVHTHPLYDKEKNGDRDDGQHHHFGFEMGVDFKGQAVDAHILDLAAVRGPVRHRCPSRKRVCRQWFSRIDDVVHLCRQGL
jgi:hypothetical protein